ncbi:ABC transporter substrate-binding protein [Alloscardovia venturai]|uniref:ABC transporter substrate-binding protein n=1 Tax=Alloscardovia venturai TaxID=1769421 RepID=A0ABW2Y4I1_9BIFI
MGEEKSRVNPAVIFVSVIVVLALIIGCVWGYIHRIGPFAAFSHIKNGNGTSLTIATSRPLTSLDVTTNSSTAVDQALVPNVYQTLVGHDDVNKPTQTGVARSWNISADKKTYTFTLYPHMRFSNGHVLDSADVVYSLQQTIQQHTQGADALARITNIAGKDSTVTLTLSQSDPTLLWALSTRAGIIYDSEAHYDKSQMAIGSGPYTVAHFSAGKSLTLSANPQYWRGSQNYASTVTLKTISDAQQAAQELKSGTIDAIVPLSDTPNSSSTVRISESLQTDKSLTATTSKSLHRWAVALNNDADSLFSDTRIRQGYNAMLDRTSVINQLGISANPIGGPVAELDPGFKTYPTDANLTHARSLLSYFGYARNLTLAYKTSSGADKLARILIQQFTQVGGTVTARGLSDEEWNDQVIGRKQFDMAIVDYTSSHDIGTMVDPNYFINYTNSSIESQWNAVESAETEAAYAQATETVADTLAQDVPIIWLYSETPVIASKSTLTGLPTSMVERYLPLENITVSRNSH